MTGERFPTSEVVESLVRQIIAEYRYVPPEPGTTFGTPWTAEMVEKEMHRLRTCLVKPRRQRFLLEESGSAKQFLRTGEADMWVVAEWAEYQIWFDPSRNLFGLGTWIEGKTLPVSIGVTGDLVGVFCGI